ncbi:hypothetical protein V6N11_017263 [Hibiscus sabdariffa]|uniref:Uncharacterized protein n=1 Tax=Hibiscus sabdariffa TaxID=183260 RepID=A0ABR2TY46_9ROSI
MPMPSLHVKGPCPASPRSTFPTPCMPCYAPNGPFTGTYEPSLGFSVASCFALASRPDGVHLAWPLKGLRQASVSLRLGMAS